MLHAATVLFGDNDECTAMTNTPKPTTCTGHVEIKYFPLNIKYSVLTAWVEHNLIILEKIHTSLDQTNYLSKLLEHTLLNHHMVHILGNIPAPNSLYLT
jgi:hypothetical protein